MCRLKCFDVDEKQFKSLTDPYLLTLNVDHTGETAHPVGGHSGSENTGLISLIPP